MALARREIADTQGGVTMRLISTMSCLVASAAITAATGCGPATSTVSGTVTFNGEAVAKGAISLFPADGKGVPAGGLIVDGRYTILDVAPGEKIVQLSAPAAAGTRKDDYGNDTQVAAELMPASWGRASQNRITVTAGSVTHDFTIKGPDPRKQ